MIKITDMANAVVQWMFEYHCHLEAWRAVVGHSSTLSLEKRELCATTLGQQLEPDMGPLTGSK